ncbi:hypothetical protein MASR2M78_14660 [Treponema sp.]
MNITLSARVDREEATRQFVENTRNQAGKSEPETSFKRDSLYTGPRFGSDNT